MARSYESAFLKFAAGKRLCLGTANLEFRAQGYKTQAEAVEKALTEAKRADLDTAEKYRPYYTAKRDLDTTRRIREAVKMKLMAEKLAKDI